MSPWVLRIVLNKNKMNDLNMEDISEKIENSKIGQFISVIHSDDNSEKLVFRIRLKDKNSDDSLFKEKDNLKTYRMIEKQLMKLKLKGIDNIERVFLRELKMKKPSDEGEKDIVEWYNNF
jgi:hypothetical protein